MTIYEILSHTPIWVWALLAFLVSRGLNAMQPRTIAPVRVLIIPVVFLVWGLVSLISSRGLGFAFVLFVVGTAAGLAAGSALAALMPAPRLDRQTGLLAMPGSPIPLALILAAFVVKYAGSVALVGASDPATHAEIASAMALIGGVFAGLFWGRTLGQFRRALQADGQPVTLRTLIALAAGRLASVRLGASLERNPEASSTTRPR